MKIKRADLFILIFNIIYLIIFGFIFIKRTNYEFLIYVGAIVFLLILIGLLHLKFNFSIFSLIGISFVGLLHMLGGGIIINNKVLYGNYLIIGILRYDKVVHFFGIFFAVFLIYEMMRDEKIKKSLLCLILILSGIGIGALYEIIEFILVLVLPQTGVGGYENTMLDIVFNTIGAIFAVVWINLRKNPAQ